jgi:hypothetical protein
MKNISIPLLILGAAAPCAPSVSACDLCSVFAASQARAEVAPGPYAGVAEQFTHFGTVQFEGHELPNPSGQFMDSSISQLFAGYNLNNRIGLQFNAPIIYRSFKRPDGLGGIDRGSEFGIGDVSLLANVTVLRKLTPDFMLNWAVIGGIKFPTGSTDRIKEEFNEIEDPIGPPSGIHGHDLTLGSGSYDGLVGSYLFARWHRAFLTANIQYAIRSEGDFDYQFANDLTWSGGPGFYLALTHSYTLGLQAVVSGEYKSTDTFQGGSADDTGVTAVYLGPQLDFTWGTQASIQLGFDWPMSIQNTSLQTVPDYRVRAAFTWRF